MPWHERWRNVFRPGKVDDAIDRELAHHLAETADRLIEDHGLTEAEAHLEARRRLGNLPLQKERTRDMNIAVWLDTVRADFAYALRQLRANPGFATVAVLSLALGIGANSSMFQLVNAVRLKTLPVRAPQELAVLDLQPGSTRPGSWFNGLASVTSQLWTELQRQQQAFSGIIAWSEQPMNLNTGGEPRNASVILVSGSYFETLGVSAALGRTLAPEDDRAGSCTAGAVITQAFWDREFGRDPNILNRSVTLNGKSTPVIGVMPPSFFGTEVGNRFDAALPLCADAMYSDNGKSKADIPAGWWLSVMGRLKPGWTVERASAHLTAISPQVMRATVPSVYTRLTADGYLRNRLIAVPAATGVSNLRNEFEKPLWLLLGATALVLLITCANLANLLLARASTRQAEMAVRLAIGASRWRLIRQLLAESFLIAAAGAIFAAGVGFALTRLLVAFLNGDNLSTFVDTAPDWRVIGFTAAIAIATCILFGLFPAVRATYLPPSTAIRSGGRGLAGRRDRFGARRILVVAQIALSAVLVSGAMLFARSLHNAMTTDPGFAVEGILAVHTDSSRTGMAREHRDTLRRNLLDRIGAIPGVASVAFVSITPLRGWIWNGAVSADGTPAANSQKISNFNDVTPRYFETMNMRLLAGRDFDSHDTESALKVAIVNERFAQVFFNGANPIGRTFRRGASAGVPEPEFQVVGLVTNSKYHSVKEDFPPIAFVPASQRGVPGTGMSFVVRTRPGTSAGSLTKAIKTQVAGLSPQIGIEFRALTQEIAGSLQREQLMAGLSIGFGLLAILLATLGLYGVISYTVARRRAEFGIRMALGSGASGVIRLVLFEAVAMLCAGLAAGVLLALAAGRAAQSLLYGVEPNDIASIAASGAILASIGLLASYLPARRAASLDPMSTLREE